MTYVVTEACIDLKDQSCIEVWPVDCIHETAEDRMVYIDPEKCIARDDVHEGAEVYRAELRSNWLKMLAGEMTTSTQSVSSEAPFSFEDILLIESQVFDRAQLRRHCEARKVIRPDTRREPRYRARISSAFTLPLYHRMLYILIGSQIWRRSRHRPRQEVRRRRSTYAHADRPHRRFQGKRQTRR